MFLTKTKKKKFALFFFVEEKYHPYSDVCTVLLLFCEPFFAYNLNFKAYFLNPIKMKQGIGLRGATVARSTPDRKAACSNHVGVKFFLNIWLPKNKVFLR